MPADAFGILEAFIYGLIQGVTEFLPVSSSGHLAIAHSLELGSLPKELELPFDVLLHAASLLAIVAAFWRELWQALIAGPRVWLVIGIAIVPAGLVGLFCGDLIDAAGEHLWLIALCYVVTAGLLFFAERRAIASAAAGESEVVDLKHIHPRQALIVGLLQVPALLPGISRSGATVAAGLLAGLSPVLAVSFAFIVGLPLITAAAGLKALDGSFGALVEAIGWLPVAVAFLTSLLSGIASIALLKLVVGRQRLRWFAAYCLLIAIACFVLSVQE